MPSPQEPQQQAPMEMTPVDGVVTQQPTAEPQPEFGNMRGGEEPSGYRHALYSTCLSSRALEVPAMQWNEHHNGLTGRTENSYSYPAYNNHDDTLMHG
ncbi:hypothetical protein Daesc_009548 [Daldinia eschscholtzii]|uniref:Uncharacterized protein n=1 Tax=Daldinia eschscholtzii TaxID=292717 RepID=A0AAX6M9V7_9PEZI